MVHYSFFGEQQANDTSAIPLKGGGGIDFFTQDQKGVLLIEP